MVGELSLRLLCCRSPHEASALLLQSQHPGVLLAYSKESPEPFVEEHWRRALADLQESLAGSCHEDDHPMHEAWYSAQQEILEHLSHQLTLAEFTSVLPGAASDDEFQVREVELVD